MGLRRLAAGLLDAAQKALAETPERLKVVDFVPFSQEFTTPLRFIDLGEFSVLYRLIPNRDIGAMLYGSIRAKRPHRASRSSRHSKCGSQHCCGTISLITWTG